MANPQTLRPTTRYSDFKINFAVHPVHNDLALNINDDAIIRSIKNILFTEYYERPFAPTFGGGLRHLLFENITPVTSNQLRDKIAAAIANFEPRAKLHHVAVRGDRETHRYYISIVISTINNPNPITVEVILTRIR